MPFISDQDLEERLKSPLNLSLPQENDSIYPENDSIPEYPSSGTDDIDSYPESNAVYEELTNGKDGVSVVPLEMRKAFSILNRVNGDNPSKLAETFEVSRDTINRSVNGNITNTEGRGELSAFHEKIESKIDDKRSDAEGKAVDTLLTVLNLIPSQVPNQPFSKQLSAAKTMADIANMMGKKGSDKEATTHFHIMVPPMKKLKDYKFIEGEVIDG